MNIQDPIYQYSSNVFVDLRLVFHVVAIRLGLFFHSLHVSLNIKDKFVNLINIVKIVFDCLLGRGKLGACGVYFDVALVVLDHDLRLLVEDSSGRLKSLLVLGADLGQAVSGVTRADLSLAGQGLRAGLLRLLEFDRVE